MKKDDYSYCQVIGITDRGLKRAVNEDWLGERQTSNGWVAVVCDGMGGHVGGATASHLGVETILDFLSSEYFEDARIAIGKAIDKANSAIQQKATYEPELQGMGATCVLLIIRDGKVYIGHVGDSRIYLIRDHRIHQLTKDHSYVQMLVDMGEITQEQAEHHPRKNEITNALGIPQMQPATVMQNPIEPQAGDCFLMCSDGLSGMVDNKTIEHIVSQQQHLSAQERAAKLLEKAKEGGGLDNITVQLVEFGATPSSFNESPKIYRQWWFWTAIVALIVLVCCFIFFIINSHNVDNRQGDDVAVGKEQRTISCGNLKMRSDTIMLLTVNGSSSDTCSVVLKDANNAYLETLNNVLWRSPIYQSNKIVVNYEAMPVDGKTNGVVRLVNPSECAFYIQFEADNCIYVIEVDIDKSQAIVKDKLFKPSKGMEAPAIGNPPSSPRTNEEQVSEETRNDGQEPVISTTDTTHVDPIIVSEQEDTSSINLDPKRDTIADGSKDTLRSDATSKVKSARKKRRR